MCTPSLEDLDHHVVRDMLFYYLKEYTKTSSAPYDASAKIEDGVNPNFGKGKSHPDVWIDAALDNSDGCAFEVKTRVQDSTKLRIIDQLSNYRSAGYQPILVSPGWIFINEENLVENLNGFTLKNILKELNAVILEIVSADPIRFSTYHDSWTLAMPGLNEFFTLNTPNDEISAWIAEIA